MFVYIIAIIIVGIILLGASIDMLQDQFKDMIGRKKRVHWKEPPVDDVK